MATPTPRRDSRAKVADHRRRLRAQGLRPVQFWVPDVRTPEFAVEAERQCRAVQGSRTEQGDLDFIEAVFDWQGTPAHEEETP